MIAATARALAEMEQEVNGLRAENERLRAERDALLKGIEEIKHDLEWAMPDDMLDIQAGNIQEVIDDAGKLLATRRIEQIEGVRPPARGGIPAVPETKAIDGRVAEMIQYLDAHDGKLPEEAAT